MEKYWSLNLISIKADGIYKHNGYTADGFETLYPKYKMFRKYKLSNYVSSEVINKVTKWDFLESSGQPYKYLEVKRKFIIPSEIVLSVKYYEHIHDDDLGTIEKYRMISVMKYKVDGERGFLKPIKIIYLRDDKKVNYVDIMGRGFTKVDDRTLMLYNRDKNIYIFREKFTGEEKTYQTNFVGERAKFKIENEAMNHLFEVNPVEKLEQVIS